MTGGAPEARSDKSLTLLTFGIWHLMFDIWHITYDIQPMDLWTNGPMDQWTNGPMDIWTNVPMDQGTNGPMDQWTKDMEYGWCHQSARIWYGWYQLGPIPLCSRYKRKIQLMDSGPSVPGKDSEFNRWKIPVVVPHTMRYSAGYRYLGTNFICKRDMRDIINIKSETYGSIPPVPGKVSEFNRCRVKDTGN